MKCTQSCLTGYYKKWRPCCHDCNRSDICTNKCSEKWGSCGCERLPNSERVNGSYLDDLD